MQLLGKNRSIFVGFAEDCAGEYRRCRVNRLA
jgi:hypothetical protein